MKNRTINRQTKIIIAVIAVLAVLIGILGYGSRKASSPKDGLIISASGKETVVAWEDIQKETFEGDLVNGKGETKHHAYEGAALLSILKQAGAGVGEGSKLTVTSEDNYSAELSGQEVLEAGKVYVALTGDGEIIKGIEGGQGAQLIVFGDSNSKRAVRYLKKITIE